MSNLIIAGVELTTDSEGRFSLNALHRMSGGEKKDQPSNWLATDKAQQLIEEVGKCDPGNTGTLKIQPVASSQGGPSRGTFAVEQLAVAYANWISPSFYLTVIDAFLQLKKTKTASTDLSTLSPILQTAIKLEQQQLRLEQEQARAREQMEEVKREVSQMREEDKPKVTFARQVVADAQSLRIGEFAKALSKQEGIKVGPNKLFEFLRETGYLMTGRDGRERNKPYQKWVEAGMFSFKYEVPQPNNPSLVVCVPYITGYGQEALTQLVLERFA